MTVKKGNPRRKKKNRRPSTRKTWRKDLWCTYCNRDLVSPPQNGQRPQSRSYSKDHVKPKSCGGRRTVPCCQACNQIKSDMTIEQWNAYMQANPEWWLVWKPTGFRVIQYNSEQALQ